MLPVDIVGDRAGNSNATCGGKDEEGAADDGAGLAAGDAGATTPLAEKNKNGACHSSQLVIQNEIKKKKLIQHG